MKTCSLRCYFGNRFVILALKREEWHLEHNRTDNQLTLLVIWSPSVSDGMGYGVISAMGCIFLGLIGIGIFDLSLTSSYLF